MAIVDLLYVEGCDSRHYHYDIHFMAINFHSTAGIFHAKLRHYCPISDKMEEIENITEMSTKVLVCGIFGIFNHKR